MPKKCRKCGGSPYVVKVDECYYVRCDGCCKWHPYEFLGMTPKSAMAVWDEGNTPNASRNRRR